MISNFYGVQFIMKIKLFTTFVAFAAIFSLNAAELLTNRDFSAVSNGVPKGWKFAKEEDTTGLYKITAPENGKSSAAGIVIKDPKKRGLIMFTRKNTLMKAGGYLTISGEYRTSGIAALKSNQTITVSSMSRHKSVSNRKQPSFWTLKFLNPSDSWKSFNEKQRISFDLETFSLYLAMNKVTGEVLFRNLSVEYTAPAENPDVNAEYLWREAEDVYKFSPPNTWGEGIPDYFSGKGGIALDGKSLIWNFQIDPVTDPDTLFSKKRTFHIWARVYGYLDIPRIMIYHNDRFVQYFDTPSNEKVDKKGNYAGPGKYFWAYCGSFTTTGGTQKLTFSTKKRMMIDSFLLTTDPMYAPEKFEARDLKQIRSMDITLKNMIRAEYNHEGVTENFPLPVSFRCSGKRWFKSNEKPAVFHFSLPEFIKVKAVSSHWAGENWSVGNWDNKTMNFSKTGSREVHGIKYCDYQVPLYYICGNQYLIFLQADKSGFKPGSFSQCEYFLESDGEKQPAEKILLQHVSIPRIKPFKDIFIGPSYLTFGMIYLGMPDAVSNIRACGLNYLGCFGKPWIYKEKFEALRDKAYSEKMRVSAVVDLYHNLRKEDAAYDINGVQDSGKNEDGKRIISLACDENTPAVQDVLKRTEYAASHGISVEYDDEMSNGLGDRADYAPATKELFRKYLTSLGKGDLYQDPVAIVKNKKSNRMLYNLWVDFKCARMASFYALYRKAFEKGLKKASGKYPAELKPWMITCVQGSTRTFPDVRSLMENSYWDYKLLGQYCDIVQVMAYSYEGVAGSGYPAESLIMHNNHTGKKCTAPILLTGGYGTEIKLQDKVMLKYQILDCLMEQPRLISFYAGATLFNAPTLVQVVEAIRIAQPYEEFFTAGKPCSGIKSSRKDVLVKGLQLGKKIVMYASCYRGDSAQKVEVTFPERVKKVTELNRNLNIPVKGGKITFDFLADRGKMFLLEL